MPLKCPKEVFDLDLCKNICELRQYVGLFPFFPQSYNCYSLKKTSFNFEQCLVSCTYTHSQILGDTEEGVGQDAGGPAMQGLTAGVADKDLIHVKVQELPEEAAAICSLKMGKMHESLICLTALVIFGTF